MICISKENVNDLKVYPVEIINRKLLVKLSVQIESTARYLSQMTHFATKDLNIQAK